VYPSDSIVRAAVLRRDDLIAQATRERFLDQVESARSARRPDQPQQRDPLAMLKSFCLIFVLHPRPVTA
jgi:hypothetical protein